MNDNKHIAVWTWLLGCPYIYDLCFNFSETENGETVIIPDTAYNDVWQREYISSSGEKAYTFTLVRFVACSVEKNSTENIEKIIDVENIAAWIDEQNVKKNYPKFPENCIIQDITVLPFANGGLAGKDESGAKYMFSIKIEYLYKKEG